MKNLFFFILLLGLAACDPFQSPEIELPAPPNPPTFSVEFLAGDSNTVIVKDLSEGTFSRVWNFGENENGNTPVKRTSTLETDTVTYQKAGTYTITLHVAASDGGGTAQKSQTITIANDAQLGCSGTVALLTGDCLAAGKCWTFSTAAGAVRVGPTQGDGSWYSSPLNGLQTAQYDDGFCFFADGGVFQYNNNGQTVDPWNGYVPVDFTPPANQTWTFSAGTGEGGKDQIILPTGAFLGVWDDSSLYDILSISENEMVVQTPFLAGGGWFELTFVKQ
jgi:PKD repeat protein